MTNERSTWKYFFCTQAILHFMFAKDQDSKDTCENILGWKFG